MSNHLRALIRAGRKIEAIRVYRELHGVGLKEAKDAVEAMERRLNLTNAPTNAYDTDTAARRTPRSA